MSENRPVVGIIMGSQSDWETMKVSNTGTAQINNQPAIRPTVNVCCHSLRKTASTFARSIRFPLDGYLTVNQKPPAENHRRCAFPGYRFPAP